MDWPGWIMAVVAVVGLGGGLYAWFASQIASLRTKIDEDMEAEANARLAIERDVALYKLYVAQNLVTSTKMKETEERLIAAFDKLVTRIDLLGSRMEDLTIRLASASRSRRVMALSSAILRTERGTGHRALRC